MKPNDYSENNRLDNVQLLNLLDKLEVAKNVLDKSGDIDDVIDKLNTLEIFLRRFGTIKELTTHLMFIEKKMYLLKEFLTVQEAAEYLNLSSSLIYKLTSKHDLPVYKPNGKTIFLRRDDLNRWIARNKVASQEEIEEYARNNTYSPFIRTSLRRNVNAAGI
jgi:excisionase family DNA binding protein